MTPAQIRQLGNLLGEKELITGDKLCSAYGGDKWYAHRVPDAVVLARSAESVSSVLKWANKHEIPVTPRGAGYGYVGGCVPVRGGIVLCVDSINRILEVSVDDFIARVQPGVRTAKLQERVAKKGLFYPPDPASREDCSIGGNIATNAGGPKCLKYGVTRDYVLGLEVVLPCGTITRMGSRTHKNKTGFDLSRFFVGSEGMLGVITEATLKLLPMPTYRAGLSIGFATMKDAARAIKAVFAHGYLPAALEVADEFTLAAALKRTGNKALEGCKAHIILEMDGREKSVRSEIRDLASILGELPNLWLRKAFGAGNIEAFWALRREFSYSLRDTGLKKLNEDITVPRGSLEKLFTFTSRLQKKYQIPVACFGHAGDGNIHVNLMVDTNDSGQVARQEKALDELFKGIIDMGGVVSGEHGIGLAKMPWWDISTSPESRELHHKIKNALDPKGILNPGKFL